MLNREPDVFFHQGRLIGGPVGVPMTRKAIECVNCGANTNIDSLTDCIIVNGKVARIPGLEEIMARVTKMRLDSRSKVANELLRQVKEGFIIPVGEEEDFRLALMDDYERRTIEFM
jgi:hypothetical protein